MAHTQFRHAVWADFQALSVRRHNMFFFLACLVTRAGFLAVFLYRLAALCETSGASFPYRAARSLLWRASILFCSCDISPRAVIGPGLKIPHPVGVVIGHARIGGGAMIMQNCTLGMRWFDTDENDPVNYPTLGNKVIICAGAQVLGPVTVHDHAVIGANAVVLIDVPVNTTVVGAPAYIVELGVRSEAAA